MKYYNLFKITFNIYLIIINNHKIYLKNCFLKKKFILFLIFIKILFNLNIFYKLKI